jgi:hypothetical protein
MLNESLSRAAVVIAAFAPGVGTDVSFDSVA